MNATEPVIPIWLFFLIVGIALLIVGLLILLMEYGPDIDRARADDLLGTDDLMDVADAVQDEPVNYWPTFTDADIQRLHSIFLRDQKVES